MLFRKNVMVTELTAGVIDAVKMMFSPTVGDVVFDAKVKE
jgi:hypothetical protein